MLPHPLPAPAVRRRTLLAAGGLGVTGAVAAGCSATGGGATATPEPAPPSATATLAPDVAVATSALEQIRRVRQAVELTSQRFPAVPDLGRIARMHRSHESSLVDAVPERARTETTASPYAVPPRREVALRRLATQEQRLHSSLDGLALRAQSGDFARLLAAMGAGIGQRLAGWPE